MPPPVNHEFAREDVFPSYWANALQRYLTAASAGIRLTRKSGTIVQVVPDATVGACGLAIEGRWRFNEATVERTHPGGAKGTYVVWAVAEDEDIDNAPDPFTDNTVYSFELRITSGAAPEGAGIDIVEKIGEIDWSGSAIERIRQTHGAVTGPLLGDGALSGSGDIDWTREASGAWVPDLKAESVGPEELTDSLLAVLGVTDSEAVRRGVLSIATEQSRENVGYGLMTTPDRIQNVVLPTDGIICVAYQAWAKNVGSNAHAAIFLGENQIRGWPTNETSPVVLESAVGDGGGAGNAFTPLVSWAGGLQGAASTAGTAFSDVTTGRVLGLGRGFYRVNNSGAQEGIEAPPWSGGVCMIEAAAGTYDVSVRFRAEGAGQKVTVKNRKLRVWTISF